MAETPPVFHANGRKAHLAPGLFHLCSWTNSRWEKGATFEVLSKAKDLANSCLAMGLAPRYVIVRPSGHEDLPDLVEFVGGEAAGEASDARCIECEAGKHRNCTNEAMNAAGDIVACPCAALGHATAA